MGIFDRFIRVTVDDSTSDNDFFETVEDKTSDNDFFKTAKDSTSDDWFFETGEGTLDNGFFGEENKDMHYDYNQVKRIESAKKLKDEQIVTEDLTPGKEHALIQGTEPEPYRVTLNTCSCFDFSAHGKPCKHMYRLALDAGRLELPAYKKRKSSRNIDKEAEIEHYKQLYISGDLDGSSYAKICSILAKTK
jgi:hypothetical protein